MAEIINLRRVRRRIAKADTADAAAENRARFGRTKAEAAAETLQATQAARLLDGAKLEPPDQTGTANPEKDSVKRV